VRTPSEPTTPSAAEPALLPEQRLDSLDDLNRRWRVTVDQLTDLSIELHTYGGDVPPERVALVEARLASVRRNLVEIETSLQRARSRALSAVAG